jgi:hypothetical protein
MSEHGCSGVSMWLVLVCIQVLLYGSHPLQWHIMVKDVCHSCGEQGLLGVVLDQGRSQCADACMRPIGHLEAQNGTMYRKLV